MGGSTYTITSPPYFCSAVHNSGLSEPEGVGGGQKGAIALPPQILAISYPISTGGEEIMPTTLITTPHSSGYLNLPTALHMVSVCVTYTPNECQPYLYVKITITKKNDIQHMYNVFFL